MRSRVRGEDFFVSQLTVETYRRPQGRRWVPTSRGLTNLAGFAADERHSQPELALALNRAPREDDTDETDGTKHIDGVTEETRSERTGKPHLSWRLAPIGVAPPSELTTATTSHNHWRSTDDNTAPYSSVTNVRGVFR